MRALIRVDLPDPEGAEIMMTFDIAVSGLYPLLHHVKYLLFDLLQLVFHLNHDVLHLGMVALATQRVDFAAHLLSNETEFFSLPFAVAQGLQEVVQVVG